MLAEAYYDVALLKVNKGIEFSIVIYPICLPPEDLQGGADYGSIPGRDFIEVHQKLEVDQ